MDDNSRKRPLSGQWLIDTAERVRQKPRVGSIDASNATSSFSGQGIQHTGQGNFNVRGNVNITPNNTVAEDCLRSLFITDPSEDRTALKRKKGNRAAGTCEWVLETDELTAWLGQEKTSNILWLYGNPGTGKSTMAIYLTEKLSSVFSATEKQTLAFFFCDSSFDKRKTATSVIRGLLYQLVQQHRQLLDYILPKYKERGEDLFQSFDALWAIFMAIATDQKTGQKYCVIDALDECDRESQEILLQQFQETFHSQDAPSNVRILVTSRPYSEICEYLDEFTNKDLASFPQAKKDIDQCIEERVADLVKKKHYTVKVKEQVSNILRDKAESTFLWVGLACEELKEIPSKDAVKVLQNMPKGLHSLYKTLLDTAQEKSESNILRHILSLVAVCMRPLSVLELSEACQLYEEEADIETRVQFTRDQIASCRLMIVVQDDKVLLLHQSVKDYLVGSSSGYFIDELEAHANIVYRCVGLLMKELHGREQSRMQFISYAIERWPDHARMAQSKFEVRNSEAEFFQVNSPSREHWLKTLYNPLWDRDITPHMSILHIAARWEIAPLVDYVTACNQNCQESDAKKASFIDVDCIDAHNATPIEIAAKWGSISVISKLLCLGAEVDEYVVASAATNSKNGEEAMTLLLDQRGHQITITEDIVKAATRNNNGRVIALLFDRRGDQITITEDIVKAAAKYSEKEVMALLFDRFGHQITVTKDILEAAAFNEDQGEEVMTLLFDQCGDQIIITEDIVKAAAGNKGKGKEIMTLLLNRYQDQIIITSEVLCSAVFNDYRGKEILAVLLDRCGSQIDITEDIIMAAVRMEESGKDVMGLLLDQRGDQITITKGILKELMANEVSGGDVMALLLDRYGDEIDITEDIIEAAAAHGQNEILNLLSQQDLFISDWDKWHSISNFYKAAQAGDVHIIEQLLDQGVNPVLKDSRGFTPLSTAAESGHEAVVKILSQRTDVDINSRSEFGESPLSLAAEQGHERIVTILLEAGADPGLKDYIGYMAVDRARQSGYERIVEILERVA
ncbi:hypothetical protein CFAM422_001038 [Trichoderma lentiforme]|uniref:NACHT domain-containing protein n=1 Tax=Trichoderma lentiforme TaxID=1567552 RepID=A0A9P5CIU6_9HYPO|nr:hypothetical protein CFAM422_001038 [Trichoderma lentiforme]